jgi:hypothetical protein
MKTLKELNKKQIRGLEKELIKRKDEEPIIEGRLSILYDLEKIYLYIKDEKKLEENKKEIIETLNVLFDDEI